MGNVAVVAPAATVTLFFETNAGEPLVHNSITIPPVAAAVLRVTVPVAEPPAITDLGLVETEFRPAAGLTISATVLRTPL
jgi:hypothetical protein